VWLQCIISSDTFSLSATSTSGVESTLLRWANAWSASFVHSNILYDFFMSA
jgi:hypothetical protein